MLCTGYESRLDSSTHNHRRKFVCEQRCSGWWGILESRWRIVQRERTRASGTRGGLSQVGSIAARLQINGAPTDGAPQSLFSWHMADATADASHLGSVQLRGNQLGMNPEFGGGSVPISWRSDEWHNVVVSWNAIANRQGIYVDGSLAIESKIHCGKISKPSSTELWIGTSEGGKRASWSQFATKSRCSISSSITRGTDRVGACQIGGSQLLEHVTATSEVSSQQRPHCWSTESSRLPKIKPRIQPLQWRNRESSVFQFGS